ncbi:indolepyruvate oxidoreductase subunit beta [Dysosmobacter sp.]|uniref:indolepyruvate oxidoreductase subunit beta n=1 Tax=Dysosmobacter sp. TaxID=2591382 RepID=UPI002A8E1022|nr:indolepyruvate oxidoreductase subunit beta [Dysosmobacter sp.]MDY3281204.1 indolepyruvate oxidoreductase subunit beta [Dysosmobacter sp.]
MKTLKFDPLNIVICGIGGQGNVLASEVVGSAMNDRGYRVAVGETYGASQRGGSVMSHVRVSADKEMSVLIPSGEAHIIIGFEPLETLRMARKYAGPDTMIVYDPRPVYPLGVLQGVQTYPAMEDIAAEIQSLSAAAYAVPAADIAMEVGDSRSANIALLGAFTQLPDSPLSREDLEKILTQRFRGAVLELNRRAFAMGCEAVSGKGGAV